MLLLLLLLLLLEDDGCSTDQRLWLLLLRCLMTRLQV